MTFVFEMRKKGKKAVHLVPITDLEEYAYEAKQERTIYACQHH